MIKRFFKHGFIAGCLLLSLSATDSYARSRYESTYQSNGNGNYYQPYGSRLFYGYRSGYTDRYTDYGYRNGYRDGRRIQRRRDKYRRSSYYGNYGTRYCPTPRRYRGRRRW